MPGGFSGWPAVCVSRSRTVIGRLGFLRVSVSAVLESKSICPLNSGRCFSTGSSSDSFPSSTNSMIPIAVIGLVIDMMRKMASLGIGCAESRRWLPTAS